MDRKNLLKNFTTKTIFPYHSSILLDDFYIFHLDISFMLVKSFMKFDTLDDSYNFSLVYLAMAQMLQK